MEVLLECLMEVLIEFLMEVFCNIPDIKSMHNKNKNARNGR
jgi:hypothetical protein